MSCLTLAAVSVRVDAQPLLSGLDFEVACGEWVGLVGPNGAGKTTLLRAIAGLHPADGNIEIRQRQLSTLSHRERAQAIAYVPQQLTLPVGLSVADYILLGRTAHRSLLTAPKAADQRILAEVLAELDLRSLRNRAVETLSGGEMQRVALARALAQDAPVLLLDEPTAALDIAHQVEVLELVRRVAHDRSIGVVSTMHDLTTAGTYPDRLVLLGEGGILAQGNPLTVLNSQNIERAYGIRIELVQHGDAIAVLPLRESAISVPNAQTVV